MAFFNKHSNSNGCLFIALLSIGRSFMAGLLICDMTIGLNFFDFNGPQTPNNFTNQIPKFLTPQIPNTITHPPPFNAFLSIICTCTGQVLIFEHYDAIMYLAQGNLFNINSNSNSNTTLLTV